MKCPLCQTNSHVFNMSNICCLARHVLMQFYPSLQARKDYPQQLADRYKVDVTELINEINEMKGTK